MEFPIRNQTSCQFVQDSPNGNNNIPTLQSPSSYQEHRKNAQLKYQQQLQQQEQQEQQQQRRRSIRRNPSTSKGPGVSHNNRNDDISNDIIRGTPTDETRINNFQQRSPNQVELAKRRSQYFDEVFSAREPYHTPRNRVNQDSIVIVEIKTNVQINGAFAFVSDLSFNLAQTFQRPESSIMITLDDNVNLIFGSSDEPAYLVTISALPCMIAPVTNLRHTILVQEAINDTLGIPANRGVIKFISMPEENFATNGSTFKDEIEKMERISSEENSAIKNFSRTMSRKIKSNTSSRISGATTQVQSLSSAPAQPPLSPIRSGLSRESSLENPIVLGPGGSAGKGGRNSMLKRCKSFFTR